MKNKQGVALLTALVFVLVLSLVMSLMFTASFGELRQSRASIQRVQALAVAEAGEVYGDYVLQNRGRSLLTSLVSSDVSSFLAKNKSAKTEPIIVKGRWSAVAADFESALNGSHSTLAQDAVNNLGSAKLVYEIENFREDERVRSENSQMYLAEYKVVATGTVPNGRRRVENKGSLSMQIGRVPLSHHLFLVDDAEGSNGFFPTGSVFNGPVHANRNWGFWGSPRFLGLVTTSSDGAYYYNKKYEKTWVKGDSLPPDTVPYFAQGFQRNQPLAELPTSVLSQERAALGLPPGSTAALTDSERAKALGLKGSSVPSGVYLANRSGSISGGFYIKGSLDSLRIEASRTGQQKYTFVQGGKTWIVIADYKTGTTSVISPLSPVPQIYAGVPNGQAPLEGGPTGQIYVDGDINNLSAPARLGNLPADPPDHPVPSQIPPALSLETQLNITATKKVIITSDLVYECDPTGGSAGLRCAGRDVETVLGVSSFDDHVTVAKTAPKDLYLWGAYLAAKSGKGLYVEDYNSGGAKGKMRLFGSLIQSKDQLRGNTCSNGLVCNGYLETFDYDQRFANGALAPPNFPTVRLFAVNNVNTVPLSFQEY